MMSTSSRDGVGSSDHDLPFQFGQGPHIVAPWPFTIHQFARLLVLRGRLHTGFLLRDRGRNDGPRE